MIREHLAFCKSCIIGCASPTEMTKRSANRNEKRTTNQNEQTPNQQKFVLSVGEDTNRND